MTPLDKRPLFPLAPSLTLHVPFPKTLTFRYIRVARRGSSPFFGDRVIHARFFSHSPSFSSYAGVNDPVTRSRRFLPLFRPLQGCRAHHLPFVLFVLFLLSPSINTLPQKERCGNPDVCPTLIHAHSALDFLGQYINGLQPN